MKEIEKLDIEYERWKDSEGISLAKMKPYLHHRDHQILEMVKKEIEKERVEESLENIYSYNEGIRDAISVIDKIKETDNNPEQGKGEK